MASRSLFPTPFYEGALSDMVGAVAAEAPWLAAGNDMRFMNEVALRISD